MNTVKANTQDKLKASTKEELIVEKRSYKGKLFLLLTFTYLGYLAFSYLYEHVLLNYILEALSKGEFITYYEELPRFWDMIWFFEAYDNYIGLMDSFVRSIPKQWDSLIIRSLSSYKYNSDVIASYNSPFLLDLSVFFFELKTIIGFAPFTGLQFIHFVETIFEVDHLYVGVHIPYPRYEEIETHYWYRMLSNVLVLLLCDYEEFNELYMGVWEFLPKDYYFLGFEIEAIHLVFNTSMIIGFLCSFLTLLGEPTTVVNGFFDFYSTYLDQILGVFEGTTQYVVLFFVILALIGLIFVGILFVAWKSVMLCYGFLIYYIVGPLASIVFDARHVLLLLLDNVISYHNEETGNFWIYILLSFSFVFFILLTITSVVSLIDYIGSDIVRNSFLPYYMNKVILRTNIKQLRRSYDEILNLSVWYSLHLMAKKRNYKFPRGSAKETKQHMLTLPLQFIKRPRIELLVHVVELISVLYSYHIVEIVYQVRVLIRRIYEWVKFQILIIPGRIFAYFNQFHAEMTNKLILNNRWYTTKVIDLPMTPREKRKYQRLISGPEGKKDRDALEFRESFRFYHLRPSELTINAVNTPTFLLPIPFVLTNNFILVFNYFKNNMINDRMIPISTYRTQNYGPKRSLTVSKYRSRFVNYRGKHNPDANLLLGDESYVFDSPAYRITPRVKGIHRGNRSVNFFDDKYRMGKKRKLRYAFPEHDTSEWRVYSYPHFSQLLTKEGVVDGMGIDITDATSNSGSGMQQFFTTYSQVRDEALEKFMIPWLMAIGLICLLSLFRGPRIVFKYLAGGLFFPYFFFTEYWMSYEFSFDLYQGLLQWMDAEWAVVHPEDFDMEARADGDTEEMFEEWFGDWREFTAIQLPDYEYGYRIVELLKDGHYIYRGDNFTWRMTKYMEGNLYRGRLIEWDQLMRVKTGNKRMGGQTTIYATRCYMRMQHYTTQYAYNRYMFAEKRIPGLISKDMDLVHYRVTKSNLMRTYVLKAINPAIKISRFHPDHGVLNKEPDVTMNNSMEIQRLAAKDPRLIRKRITTPLNKPTGAEFRRR